MDSELGNQKKITYSEGTKLSGRMESHEFVLEGEDSGWDKQCWVYKNFPVLSVTAEEEDHIY